MRTSSRTYPQAAATAEQVEKLTAWLTELEGELRGRIEDLESDDKKKEQRLAALRAEFDALRERVKTVPLRSFIRSLAARVYRVSSDPKLGQLVANAEKVAGLLGGGGAPAP